jgi:hypothetical protein
VKKAFSATILYYSDPVGYGATVDALILMLAIAAVVILLAIISLIWAWKRQWKSTVDYRNYFNIGVIWMASGAAIYAIFQNALGVFFFIIGLAFLLIGYKNKDKWGIIQEVDPTVQKRLMIAITLGVIIFVIGFVLLVLA